MRNVTRWFSNVVSLDTCLEVFVERIEVALAFMSIHVLCVFLTEEINVPELRLYPLLPSVFHLRSDITNTSFCLRFFHISTRGNPKMLLKMNGKSSHIWRNWPTKNVAMSSVIVIVSYRRQPITHSRSDNQDLNATVNVYVLVTLGNTTDRFCPPHSLGQNTLG